MMKCSLNFFYFFLNMKNRDCTKKGIYIYIYSSHFYVLFVLFVFLPCVFVNFVQNFCMHVRFFAILVQKTSLTTIPKELG